MDVTELAMLLNTLQLTPPSPEEFMKAAGLAKTLMGKLDDEQQMFLYGLFKQSSSGDNNQEKPKDKASIDYYKWLGWENFRGFPREDAAKAYVYIVQQYANSFGDKKDGETGKEDPNDKSQLGPSMSMFIRQDDAESQFAESQKLFKAVVDNDMVTAELTITAGMDVNAATDEQGLTPLHYAADRGFEDICKFLISNGANLNAKDNDGQTPIMYAILCDHENIVRLLVNAGADLTIANNDGESVIDLVDVTSPLRSILQFT